MKISGRNRLKGTVQSIENNDVISKVKVDIGGDNVLTSVITGEAADDLGLSMGDEVELLIKASSVMVMK